MRKPMMAISIILWIAIGVFALHSFFSENSIFNAISEKEAVFSESYSLENINLIRLDSSSFELEIIESQDNKLAVSLKAEKDDVKRLKTTTLDNEIFIEFEEKFKILSFDLTPNKLILEIPKEWYGDFDATVSSGGIDIQQDFKWKDIKINGSSGTIKMQNLDAQSLEIHNNSGGLKSENLTIEQDLSLKTTSGTIKINGKVSCKNATINANSGAIKLSNAINCESISLKTTSGSIRTESDITANSALFDANSGGISAGNVNVKDYNFETTSGSIKVEQLSGSGNIKCNSGGITAILSKDFTGGDIKSTSGSVRLKYDSELSFSFQADTSSGTIRTDVENMEINEDKDHATGSHGQTPTANLVLSANSGGITIEQE